MKFTSPKRIIVEDFPKEDRETVGKLGFVINSVFEQIGQMFTKNLNIADNLNEALVTIQITADFNGLPVQRNEFRYNLKGQCQGLQVISATNLTNVNAFPVNQPFITFEQLSTGLINIRHISGLQANTGYSLIVRVTGP